jgi:hypothetical protein
VNIVVMDPSGKTFRIRNRFLQTEEGPGSVNDLESGLIIMAAPDEVDVEMTPHISPEEIAEENTEETPPAKEKIQRNFLKPLGAWMSREGIMEYLVLFLIYFATISSIIMAALTYAV